MIHLPVLSLSFAKIQNVDEDDVVGMDELIQETIFSILYKITLSPTVKPQRCELKGKGCVCARVNARFD